MLYFIRKYSSMAWKRSRLSCTPLSEMFRKRTECSQRTMLYSNPITPNTATYIEEESLFRVVLCFGWKDEHVLSAGILSPRPAGVPATKSQGGKICQIISSFAFS